MLEIKKIYQYILDIIAPPFCLYCKKFLQTHMVLCSGCRALIKPVVSKSIAITKTKSMRVLAIGAYQAPLKSLILAKSRSNRAVSYQLGTLVWDCSYIRNIDFDYIVPIPLHWARYAWRGYNQAQVMARYISQQSGKPIVQLLKRKKHTPYLSNVRGVERASLVKNIFALVKNDEQYKNKKILLIDDLMTTGVTLQSAAKQLLVLKPESITAVVAARVV